MATKSRKSSKRQSKAAKKGLTKRKQTLFDRLPKNEIEYTELLIWFTERAINPKYPDQAMIAQAERLKAKLAELKAK